MTILKVIHRVLFVFAFMAVFLTCIIPEESSDHRFSSFETMELIASVETLEQAKQLSIDHNLNLSFFSKYGYAVFSADTEETYRRLLDVESNLFHPNGVSRAEAPPFKSKEDLSKQYALTMMNTIQAWDVTTGLNSTVVAVIDTGIDINHPEFTGRISPMSYNSKTKAVGVSAVIDDDGHGTMVAGIIAANKGNNIGIAGVAPTIQLLIIKANEPDNGSFLDSSIIEGIYYAANNGADVINLSLGGEYANPMTKIALEYAESLGVLVVAAAGNSSSSTKMYPAAFPSTISVSAVDETSSIATYSNFGDTITIAAPGTNIYTTLQGGGFGYASGTSLAAPHVAGVLALMVSHLSDDIHSIKERLIRTSHDLGAFGLDPYYGYGLLNTYDSLTHPLVTVSFETFGGSEMMPIRIAKDRTFMIESSPLKDGVVFEGWYADLHLTQPWSEQSDVASTDITLYAKYSNNSHIVTFITSGTDVEPIHVAHGSTFPIPLSLKEQHDFMGWFLDDSFENAYVSQPVYSDLTLYAHFIEIQVYYNIMFVSEGTPLEPVQVKQGDTYLPPDSLMEGHHFLGWYLDQNFTQPYLFEPIFSHQTLYAKFERMVFTITFLSSGTDVEPLYVEYLSFFNLPTTEKSGHLFLGWFLDEALMNPYVSEEVTSDMTLYAGFERNHYVIQFVTEGSLVEPITVLHGDTFELPLSTKEGYFFINWYVDSTFTTVYVPSPVDASITLYALFDETQRFTVSFQANGSWLDSLEILPYQTFDLPIVTKIGHTFEGWFEDIDWTIEYEPAPLMGNLTLYAKFVPISFEVLFFDFFDSILDHQTIFYGDRAVPPDIISYHDTSSFRYHFEGWNTAFEQVTDNLSIRPIYSKQFLTSSVFLLPGIDTLSLGTSWIDAGISMIDPLLTVVEVIPEDLDSIGSHRVYYHIQEGEMVWHTMVRMVNILPEQPIVEITLLPDITTIFQGTDYDDPGATSNIGNITTIGDVDPDIPGVYLITYQVVIDSTVFRRQKYVHVLAMEQESTNIPVAIAIAPNKKGWWY